jgi:hypothetical protein
MATADGNGSVYVGGYFSVIGGRNRNGMAKLASTGTGAADASWNPNPDGAAFAIVVDGAQNVYLGGDFTQLLGQARVGYVVLAPAPVVPDSFPPNCQMPSGWTVPSGANSGWSVADDYAKSACAASSRTTSATRSRRRSR